MCQVKYKPFAFIEWISIQFALFIADNFTFFQNMYDDFDKISSDACTCFGLARSFSSLLHYQKNGIRRTKSVTNALKERRWWTPQHGAHS